MDNYLPVNYDTCELCGYYVGIYKKKINLIKGNRVKKTRVCNSCVKNKLNKYFNYYIFK